MIMHCVYHNQYKVLVVQIMLACLPEQCQCILWWSTSLVACRKNLHFNAPAIDAVSSTQNNKGPIVPSSWIYLFKQSNKLSVISTSSRINWHFLQQAVTNVIPLWSRIPRNEMNHIRRFSSRRSI
jgi:hypothetical protein